MTPFLLLGIQYIYKLYIAIEAEPHMIPLALTDYATVTYCTAERLCYSRTPPHVSGVLGS